MNNDLLRRYHELRKLRFSAKEAFNIARRQHEQQIVADVVGVPSIGKMRDSWQYLDTFEIEFLGWTATISRHQECDDLDGLGGKIVRESTTRERRSQEVFSLGRYWYRGGGWIYFKPDYPESESRTYLENQKVGKAEAIRRACESRQASVKLAEQYQALGYAGESLWVDFNDHRGCEFIFFDPDNADAAFEELRALLSSLPSRNHC